TFALGLPTGATSLLYLLYELRLLLSGQNVLPLPLPLMGWLVFVGFLWLNSMLIGAWYNLFHAGHLSLYRRWLEAMRVLTLAPIAGVVESSAGFWAVARWLVGKRKAFWIPTPKVIQARALPKRDGVPKQKKRLYEGLQLLKYTASGAAIMVLYLVIPLMMLLGQAFPYSWNRLLVACALVSLGELT